MLSRGRRAKHPDRQRLTRVMDARVRFFAPSRDAPALLAKTTKFRSPLHLLTREDDLAALERKPAMVDAEIIRDFAVVGQIEHGQVCVFATFDRANAVVPAQRVGRIDRGGSERL